MYYIYYYIFISYHSLHSSPNFLFFFFLTAFLRAAIFFKCKADVKYFEFNVILHKQMETIIFNHAHNSLKVLAFIKMSSLLASS